MQSLEIGPGPLQSCNGRCTDGRTGTPRFCLHIGLSVSHGSHTRRPGDRTGDRVPGQARQFLLHRPLDASPLWLNEKRKSESNARHSRVPLCVRPILEGFNRNDLDLVGAESVLWHSGSTFHAPSLSLKHQSVSPLFPLRGSLETQWHWR